ncbi:hypothetical protein G6F46_009525 [Rhizopus delemar]|nr:hypothetical protein G6F54_004839 [Rhizopus delemar]KAG1509374.1 hypothetical protein G6F53_007497 [Rhizopus delemar]KAG1596203.1 hypothetical protein G6F47_008310 [Rhizopus delemar]KAG1611089.1 hypothetical protein G6F46_009525 [Rhizopus delemar]KAG1641259.1 hypothetical protein G6F44_006007 [Rhizopus delemar]
MTSVTASEGDNSWLKKRSTVFNNTTDTTTKTNNNNVTTKTVDKELARLKNIGAVSSVWSSKFVQEDNPEKTRSASPPLSGRYSKLNMSPRPNANYVPLTGNRTSFNNNTPNSHNPRRPLSSNSNKDLSPGDKNSRPTSNRLTTGSVSSLELNDDSSHPDTKRSSSDSTSSNTEDAASLWFQCETLKSQYSQVNARLNKANEDIAFYKRQLENLGTSSKENLEAANEEKDKEVTRVRQLAKLIVKQHELLSEYEVSLENLRKSASQVNQSDGAKSEIDALRQELAGLYKMKDEMENSIASLKAELEMSYSQMRLMMVVSTEIQNEFESYKRKMNAEITTLLAEKQKEHQMEMEALEQKLTSSMDDQHRGTISDSRESQALRIEIKKLTAVIEEKDRLSKAASVESENALSIVQKQALELQELKAALRERDNATPSLSRSASGSTLKYLKDQIAELSRTIEQKDKIINKLENQMRTQRMNMDSQMIDLTQSILEKDALLLEFMSSRNNSTDSNIMCASPTTATFEPVKATDSKDATTAFYQRQNEARRQMSQVRDFMYTTSSDEEEEEEIQASYSTDEELTNPTNLFHHSSGKAASTITHNERGPQSPAETVSSYISFDSSDEEEEQVAEIKHFSYSSVLSQSTLSLHSHNSALVSTASQNERTEPKRNSSSNAAALSPYSAAKETSWPMPPPTPPPSEPLPPLPMAPAEDSVIPPPPRRGRSKTMVREEIPSPYITSIHKTNELPRIVPLQKDPILDTTLPVPPPPRKEVIKRVESPTQTHQSDRLPLNTKWMDDPESEEEEHWSEALSH